MNPITVTLPEGFTIPVNMGLHGDTQFFEGDTVQLTVSEPKFEGETVSFEYRAWDSNEGTVLIKFINIDGDDAESTIGDADSSWDVEITTGSDVWGLRDTQGAINDAIELHVALGRFKGNREF